MRPPRLLAAVLAIVAVTTIAAQRAGGPILVLISFDGFRADYPDRGLTPNLSALAARGVRARSLISAFPSVTFPNHYAIVTGLRPEHHGVVANNMEDPAWPERFTMAAFTSKDPRWWGGEPIWVTARLQGRRAAAVFWPGSEVPIRGVYPDYWTVFDDEMPNVDRVGHALDLLSLRDGERPSFLTVYFSEVDHAGHDFGPGSPEMTEAIRHVDDSLGQLVAGVRRLGLLDRTVFVVVSDHGMAPLAEDRIVYLDDYIDLSAVDVVDWEMPVKLHPRDATNVDQIYRALKGKHPAMTVYKREELPERFHYRDNPRIQPIILLGNEGWEIASHARRQNDLERHRKRGGAHGYDPQLPSMQGIFIAAGPGIARGKSGPSFENVHVYEFLCRVLGLKPAKNDGDPAVTRAFLTL